MINFDKQLLDKFKYVNSDVVEPLFYTTDVFEKEREKISFIKKVESVIRKAIEYNALMHYIKDELKLDNCAVFSAINSKDVLLEIHHAPFTLFDIVETMLNKRLDLNIPITSLSLAEEVLILHYGGEIGLIQVSKTVHDLMHSGKISPEPNQIIGDVHAFYTKNKVFLSEAAEEKYLRFKDKTEDKFVLSDLLDESLNATNIEKKAFINDYLMTKDSKKLESHGNL